jgi:uncharacterized membrane protein
MKARYYSIAAVLVAAALVAYFLAQPHLAPRIPTHWNAHGEVDGWGSPLTLLWVGPGLMALIAALFAALPWLSPRRFAIETFERTYLHLMLIVVAMPGYFFAVVLWAAVTGETAMTKAILGGVCLSTLLVGNLLGKVRRNFFIGIRTPWTLASERTWYATHRFAGKSIVGTSAAGAVVTAAGGPGWVVVALILLGFAAPVVYSLVYSKRVERDGEPNGAV